MWGFAHPRHATRKQTFVPPSGDAQLAAVRRREASEVKLKKKQRKRLLTARPTGKGKKMRKYTYVMRTKQYPVGYWSRDGSEGRCVRDLERGYHGGWKYAE